MRPRDPEKEAVGVALYEDDSRSPNIVTWDGPDDPANPMNWSVWSKSLHVGIVSAFCFLTPLASPMVAPALPAIMAEFKSTNHQLAAFVVSIPILGYAMGPLVFAPLSELYGRLPVYHACNFLFMVFTIACALATSLDALIIFQLFAGIFGSVPITNGAGTIADLVRQEKRGMAMSLLVFGPALGPMAGPVVGGYLADIKGWRWIFWFLAICTGVCLIISYIFMHETNAAAILGQKTKRLRKETQNKELSSKLDTGLSAKDVFWRGITRPTKLLFLSPIVFLTSMYAGTVYGYLFLLFTTFPTVFIGQYGFGHGLVGLCYLGLGTGGLVGLTLFSYFSDRVVRDKAALLPDGTPGEMKPEYRLPPILYAAVVLPVGLFIYGWTAQYKLHYMLPIFGTFLVGISYLPIIMCVVVYLVDAYPTYAASAVAANTVLRSALGCVLPLAGPAMYETLGLGWGNSVLGFIAVIAVPASWLLIRHGEQIRKKFDMDKKL